jgi:protein subunit release factor B
MGVKCQQERSQGLNRYFARKILADKIEEAKLGAESKRVQAAERIRRQKRRRSRRAKNRMLADKHARAGVKSLRGPVKSDGD